MVFFNRDFCYVFVVGVGVVFDCCEDFGIGVIFCVFIILRGGEVYVNDKDRFNGFVVNGIFLISESQGVYLFIDVFVYVWGLCQEIFGGIYSNIDVFYKIVNCLGLVYGRNVIEGVGKRYGKGKGKGRDQGLGVRVGNGEWGVGKSNVMC